MSRNYLDFVLSDIKEQKQYTEEEVSTASKLFKEFDERVHQKYPNFDFFTIATGKDYGDKIERYIKTSFNLEEPEDSSYDGIGMHNNKKCKIEIKSIRAVRKPVEGKFLVERIMTKSDKKGFSTSSFQQSKPTCCDYFIFHILYGNSERLFIVPSKMVSHKPGKNNIEPGKILLSIQHRDHESEGQINLGQILKYAGVFEIKEKYDHKGTYVLDTFISEIEKNLDAINWTLK